METTFNQYQAKQLNQHLAQQQYQQWRDADGELVPVYTPVEELGEPIIKLFNTSMNLCISYEDNTYTITLMVGMAYEEYVKCDEPGVALLLLKNYEERCIHPTPQDIIDIHGSINNFISVANGVDKEKGDSGERFRARDLVKA